MVYRLQRKNNTLEKSRKLFYDRYGVDAWSRGFCFDIDLINSLTFTQDKNVDILGINSGFGSNPLKIQDCYKQQGIVATVYNTTDEKCYEFDLKGVSDFIEITNKENLSNVFNNNKFDYILFEKGIKNTSVIKDLKLRLKKDGVLCIYILDKDNLKMPKAYNVINATQTPDALTGKWYIYKNYKVKII